MSEVSEHEAVIADMSIIVRARFVEAVDTVTHLQSGNVLPAQLRTAWPSFPGETVGGHHAGYRNNGNRIAYVPPSDAISRMEEVFHGWLIDFLPEKEDRVLALQWAMSLAIPKHIDRVRGRKVGSFREFCRETGRNRTTAEATVRKAFVRVARGLFKNDKSLQRPCRDRTMPMMPKWANQFDMVVARVEKEPTFFREPGAKPTNRSDFHAKDRAA